MLKKREAWTVCRFKEKRVEGVGKKEGDGVFQGEGVDTPMYTMP